jgi:NAD(P)-dependent dehydrogenase (short-subunit alcohol dehydrogenase family)
MSIALAEAGCKHVYALDLPNKPSLDFEASKAYVKRMGSDMHYISTDVTDKPGLTDAILGISREHGRLDVCVAAAGT